MTTKSEEKANKVRNKHRKRTIKTREMTQEFIRHARHNKGLSETTCKEYEKDLKAIVDYLRNVAGVSRWSEVTRKTLELMVSDWNESGYQAATIRKRISVLRQAYAYACHRGQLKENPAQHLSTPKPGAKNAKTLDLTEVRATVRDEEIEVPTRAIIALMTESGLRVTEARTLKAEDIDLKKGKAIIAGKGNKQRTVYLGTTTMQLLKRLKPQNGTLFKTEDRETRANIHKALKAHSKSENCTPHALRHTFATTMLLNGAELITVSTLMGHASTKATERYVHLGTAAQAKAHTQYAPKL